LGSKEAKKTKTEVEGVIFKTYSGGVKTNRDAWAYNFNTEVLADNMQRTIDLYNDQVEKWLKRENREAKVDDLVLYDDSQLSWSSTLKKNLQSGKVADFDKNFLRMSLYRPFSKSYLYFDSILIDRPGQFPKIFPTSSTENENRVICVTDKGSEKPFLVMISNYIVDLHLVGAGSSTQCFPFYTEDGTTRTENLTDWALNHYQTHYKDNTITKIAIFLYIYGLLHHPGYREKYAANLKRELPRLPMAADFWSFSKSGEKLADLHLNYEQQTPYPLKIIENPKVPFSLRVEKMRLSKDKKKLIYNDFLTLDGIPKEVFDYKLGNRSALNWVIEQYRVKVDKRSGIINDPNRDDDEMYIVELVKKVVMVSLETVAVVLKLGELSL
jgi:predicted helicase